MASCNQVDKKVANPNSKGGFFTYSESSTIQSYFPYSIVDATSMRVIDQLYDGLVMLNENGSDVIGCIADKWEVSNEGKTYKFYLKSNVYFHDNDCFKGGVGRKLTADDVVFSIKLLATPNENNKNFSFILENLVGAQAFYEKNGINVETNEWDGVFAESDTVFIINLNEASETFLYQMASPVVSVIPEEGFKKYGYRNSVGCGPFVFNRVNENNELFLNRNAYYFLKDQTGNYFPYLDSIKIILASSIQNSLEMIKNKNLDALMNVPTSQLTPFLEENIDLFQSQNPSYILQASIINKEWQNIIKSKLMGFQFNSLHQLNLSKIYFEQ